MKHTKKKFTLPVKWLPNDGELKFDKGDNEYVYLSPNRATCKVGARLNKWLGKKERKVTITVTK